MKITKQDFNKPVDYKDSVEALKRIWGDLSLLEALAPIDSHLYIEICKAKDEFANRFEYDQNEYNEVYLNG